METQDNRVSSISEQQDTKWRLAKPVTYVCCLLVQMLQALSRHQALQPSPVLTQMNNWAWKTHRSDEYSWYWGGVCPSRQVTKTPHAKVKHCENLCAASREWRVEGHVSKSAGRPRTGDGYRSWSYLSPVALDSEISTVQEGWIAAEGTMGAHDLAQSGRWQHEFSLSISAKGSWMA